MHSHDPNVNYILRWETFDDEIPVNGCSSEQDKHFKRSWSASRNRSSSEIRDSRGSIVLSLGDIGPTDLNCRGSNPRHSAILAESVQSIGAHNRSIGGKICLAR